MNARAALASMCCRLVSACLSARRVALALGLLLMLAGWHAAAPAQTFDHSATLFPLTGAHEQVRCETCHIKGIFKGTPRDCRTCHAVNNERGAIAKPVNHIQTQQSCDDCHSIGSFSGAMFSHATVAAGSCATCHNGVRAEGKPANHVPTTLSCDQCHVASAFLPVRKFDHSSLGGDWTTCASCHDGKLATGQPPNHIPFADPSLCGTCHIASTLNGFSTFAGGQMDHVGITRQCDVCHGPGVAPGAFAGISRIVTMPPTSPMGPNAHIPASTACETCHIANVPGGLVPANAVRSAPGTAFGSPPPTSAQIHTGITGGCSNCHESSFVWMGMNAYPISPSTLVAGAQYLGFQTRPRAGGGSFNVADPAHPNSGDCSQCHFSTAAFTATDRPDNHIPFAASAQCNACHTTSDYSVMPTLANIHANAPSTTTNCAQCHGAAAPSFAIPAANFSIVGLPNNHIPTSASCEACHVGAGSSIAALPVNNGAKFSGSLMSHSGITNNCAACHGPSVGGTSFAGIARIVTMPPTSPAGTNSHIPSSTTCETCHLGSTPSGLIPASATKTAPGSDFATPVPTSSQIHTGVSSGCSSCHDTNFVWMGMSNYPIAPSTLVNGAQYTGFQTRPHAAAGTFSVADAAHPSAGDCSQCHSSTAFFTAQDKPANHIPTAASAQCNACHTSTDFSVMPTLANIHANAPSTTGNCAQCHGAAAPSFAIPAANFSIVGLPSNHLPTSASCETCHVGAGSSIAALPVANGAKFSGSLMNHSGISNNCVACHGPSIGGSSFAGIARIVTMPPTSPMGPGSHIPSSTACETCHLASMPAGSIAATASKSAPGTDFATPVPTSVQIHTGVSSGCSSCHDTSFSWMGMSNYPIAPTTLVNGAQYTGFQTRPRAAAGTFNVADAAHPSTGDCSQCHSGTNFFSAQDKPANHIPTAAGAQCNACHTSTDFSVMPTLANIHANAPSTTGNCAQCHGAAAPSFAIPAANFSIVGLPGNHLPTSASCETCHVGAGSSIAALPVANGAKFSGSLMNHTGIASNCEACHGPTITNSSFAGVSRIVVMPATTPVGPTSHIPSSTACANCHLASTPGGAIAASATKSPPGSGFATPAPTTAQIHAGVTGSCSSCHEANYQWMGVSAYPIAPGTLVAGAQYTGFQTRPRIAAGTYNVADPAHPTTGDCSQCHSGTNFFSGQDKPANHIPTAAAAQCNACHTSSDYSVIPTLANIHANAPSTTNNCAQCHGAAAASFAIPSANFSVVGLPANHIPTSASCEACHVGAGSSISSTPVGNGARFSGSLMSHSGISNNCASCHGPGITTFAGIGNIVVMPATSPMGASSHIPSSTTCETCHLASAPSGLIAANAAKTPPGTAFATPAPTTAQIHSGVTGGCSNCHESNSVWMGMSAYPISPSTLVSGAQYTGFQTRPRSAAGTFNIADAAHPSSGDCSQCHGNTNFFSGVDQPANHIPTAAGAQCSACHTSSDYSVMPTLANIHANAPSTTNNCAQCHGSAAPSFAIPAANFSIVGLPSNHIPTSSSCEACHVGAGSSIAATPVGNGAKFSGSLMNHSGITNNCVSCHGPSIGSASFVGIANIVVMPPTTPVGASSHIPSSTTCETCHLGSTPSGMIAASSTKSAPGTAFATPVPTTAQIHTGVTSGCSNCHEANYAWMGMGNYPISPTTKTTGAQYTGFQTRPRTAAGTFNVADASHPTTGDCSQCHSGTTFFSGQDKPANHIPTAASATCAACHTSSDYSVIPTLANIHANAPSTTNNCAQCHGSAAPSFAIPAANFSVVGLPSNHIPTAASCEACHVGTGSSVATTPVGNGASFANSRMSHTGITANCDTCHGPTITGTTFVGVGKIIVMPATTPVGATSHIPSSTTCESCHLGSTPSASVPASTSKTTPGSDFATPVPTTAQIHNGISSGCTSCHEANYVWMGMNRYPISPTTKTTGAQYTGFQTRPRTAAGTYNVADATHPTTGDCAQCHAGTNFFAGQDKPANHIPTSASAACNACHTSTDYAVMPTLANIHANAPSTTNNCAQCHGASAASYAIPSANFSVVGMPGNHLPTTSSCEVCHVGSGSSIAATPVGNGAKFSGSLMNHSGITNNCVSCHGPTISNSTFVGVTRIVVMPPSASPSANSHIPSGTACETCHLGSMPGTPVAAAATRSPPGTAFATPVPTTTQIHNGITGNCSSCHETGYNWMGMGSYPIAPTTLVAGAQYTGFHTRPVAAGSTRSVADAAHPATGDCSQCHSGTNYFSAQAKPPGHIPTQQQTCSICHVVSGDFSVAGLTTNMTQLHTGVSSGCIACHSSGSGAGPFAGCTTQANCPANPPLTYQPMVTPLAAGTQPTQPSKSTHIPVVGIACEKCHSPTVFTSFSGMQMKGNTTAHTAVAADTCETCHEYPYQWFGVTIRTPGSGSHHGRKAGQDCISSGCHRKSYNQFSNEARIRPVLRAAVNAARPRILPDGTVLAMPGAAAAGVFNHQGVLPGQCLTCHNGQAAKGLPVKHLATRSSCDTCHRNTAWLPAQFNHQGVLPGQCQTCHNGTAATGKSSAHFITARSCDTCHNKTLGWVPVNYSHLSPLYRPTPDKPNCVNCHITNGEIIPRQLRGGPRPRPVPPGG